MRTKKMELWNIGIMGLNQKKHFDATQYSIVPTFHHSSIHPVRKPRHLFQ